MVANPRAEELECECAPAPQLAVVPGHELDDRLVAEQQVSSH